MNPELPPIPKDLVEALEARFPVRPPSLKDPEREVWFKAGQLDLVAFLRVNLNKQEKSQRVLLQLPQNAGPRADSPSTPASGHEVPAGGGDRPESNRGSQAGRPAGTVSDAAGAGPRHLFLRLCRCCRTLWHWLTFGPFRAASP